MLVPLIFLKQTISSFFRGSEALGRQPLSDPSGPLTQSRLGKSPPGSKAFPEETSRPRSGRKSHSWVSWSWEDSP